MRPLYIILKLSLTYSLSLFYRRRVVVNGEKHGFFNSTIYVSNHPNSFMDPLVIGTSSRPVVFFMTRSDVPIRGLKPVKKGAVRMGFGALEALGWSKNIYVCGLGVNYTERNTIGSDYLIAYADKICLNDYREAYEAAPSKTINEVTKLLEKTMQECVTYVKDKNWYSLQENVMQLTRKGMSHANHDAALPLEERWNYSRRLAHWINDHVAEENTALLALKKDLESYFSLQKRMKLEDRFVLAAGQPELKNRTKELLTLLLLWPLALVGAIHGLVPYLVTKKFVEKAFGRKVFWGSVKMMLGKLLGTLWNVPIICVVTHYFLPYWWLGLIWYFLTPLLCFAAFRYAIAFRDFRLKGATGKMDISKFTERRAELKKRIEELIPVA